MGVALDTGYVAHEASGYEEWGASGAIRMTPSASGRGLTLSIAPVWGQTGSAAERLWSARDASALGSEDEFEARTGTRWQLGADAVLGLEATRQASDPTTTCPAVTNRERLHDHDGANRSTRTCPAAPKAVQEWTETHCAKPAPAHRA